MRRFVFFLVLLWSSAGHTQEPLDDYYFKDWATLTRILQSRGVNAAQIDWSEIEPACSVFKNKVEQTPARYNRCRFEKAIDRSNFFSDQNYCNAEAKQIYYSYIKPCRSAVIVDSQNITNAAELEKLSRSDKKEFLNTSFRICMRNAGWNDPANWLAGRRASYTPSSEQE